MAGDYLGDLAALLAAEPLLAPHVTPADGPEPAPGRLAGAGTRTRADADADAYGLIVEAVREGYLLHYGEPRLLRGLEPDLALLAGDHLYALGLERLAALGDLDSVRALSDLISLAAQVHDGSRTPERATAEANALWLATAAAIAAGASSSLEGPKRALRGDAMEAEAELRAAAERVAAEGRLDAELRLAAQAIESAPEPSPELG